MTTVINTLVQTPISILLGDVISLLKEKVDFVLNAKEDLRVLQQKLIYFEKALKITDHKPFFSNKRNRDLEEELKDVFYDAQDIIEGYQTTIALCKRDKHSITSWNKGEHGAALTLITEMWERRIRPTEFTFSILISVGVSNIWHGKQVHANILQNCLHDNLMYGRFSNVSYAFHLFYGMEKWEVVSCNAIMYACVRSGKPEQALTLYQRMRAVGFIHDHFSISTMVVACANLLDTTAGNEIFGVCIKTGFLSNSVVCSSIIDVFAKVNRLEDSIQLFEEMPQRDIAIFNSIISSFARLGFVEDALSFFTYAMRENNKPTEFTFGSVLGCAAWIVSMEQGRQLHSLALKVGLEADFVVSNSLVDMYAKTGNIDCAMKIFANMHSRDLVSWNTMIMAMKIFGNMHSRDLVSWNTMIMGCSRNVNEGGQLFSCMEVEHGVMPDIEHYTCMVDMLSRAGRLKQAMEIIKSMPYEPSALMWGILLRACRLHADIAITQQVAESLVALEPQESLPYVVLAQVYAMKCHWESVVRLRRMMKERGVKEVVGCSWIIMKNKVADFRADNMVHPVGEAVDNTLRLLWWDIQEMDHVLMDCSILVDLNETERKSGDYGIILDKQWHDLMRMTPLVQSDPGSSSSPEAPFSGSLLLRSFLSVAAS
ncbi:Pentatricopeptide repeat-containing protein [Nymphaea thermarum]|nr:Pentatricopeptide repeat-containing protein [Nymphaea thermarum]